MPSRSFFEVPDQAANAALMRDFSAAEQHPNIDRIASLGFAPLVDEGSLAQLIGISPKLVFSIIRKPNRHYRNFPLKKRDGRVRHINAPKTYLKVIQWWILDNILSNVKFDEHVTGFVRGKSIYQNALIHVGSKHLYNTDLKDFFPNIPYSAVLGAWQGLGIYSNPVCHQLAGICTLNGGLPQGAPTSPCIANIVANSLDRDLLTFCSLNDLKYSRYADDITVSGEERIDESIVQQISNIIARNRFTENAAKRRFRGPGQRREVTGLVVSEKVQLPRPLRKRARAAFFQALRSPSNDKRRFDQVAGYLGAISALGKTENQKLLADGRMALAALKAMAPIKGGST